MIDKRKCALGLAAKGWRIIPLAANSKKPPYGVSWPDVATTDADTIARWFEAAPDMNYGVAPREGQFILDIDTKGKINGRKSFEDLELEHGAAPFTLTVETPSGGYHLYWLGTAPVSAGKASLLGGIDVRGNVGGHGGYVVGPGCTIDDKPYNITGDYGIAPAPDWLLALCAQPKHDAVKRPPGAELDTAADVERLTRFLQDLVAEGDVAIEGAGGDNRTFKLLAYLQDYLSEDKALELLREHWNPHCVPPWSDDELATKARNAGKHRQNDQGAKATRPASTVFAEYKAPPEEVRKGRGPFDPLDLAAAENSEPPSYWDEGRLLMRTEEGCVAILSGPKGVHKTGIMLTSTIGLVFNNDNASTAYFLGEAAYDAARSRIPAICEHFGKTVEDLVATGRFALVPTIPQLLDPQQVTYACNAVASIRPNIVVLDTTARGLIGQKKNNDEVMTQAAQSGYSFAGRFNALAVLVAHEGKDAERGTKGSSDFEQMADQVISVKRQGAVVYATMKHNRLGPTDYQAAFLIREKTKPGRYDRVPVLVPTKNAGEAEERVVDYHDKLTDKQRRLRRAVREILDRHQAYDLSVRITNQMLALELAAHFPDMMEPREGQSAQEAHEQGISDIMHMLRNATRGRGKRKPILYGYYADALPPGAHAGQKEVRYWIAPRPLDDDESNVVQFPGSGEED